MSTFLTAHSLLGSVGTSVGTSVGVPNGGFSWSSLLNTGLNVGAGLVQQYLTPAQQQAVARVTQPFATVFVPTPTPPVAPTYAPAPSPTMSPYVTYGLVGLALVLAFKLVGGRRR